jgi:hypothetical protein
MLVSFHNTNELAKMGVTLHFSLSNNAYQFSKLVRKVWLQFWAILASKVARKFLPTVVTECSVSEMGDGLKGSRGPGSLIAISCLESGPQ